MRRGIFNMYTAKFKEERIYKENLPTLRENKSSIIRVHVARNVSRDITKEINAISKDFILSVIKSLSEEDQQYGRKKRVDGKR